MRTTFKSTGHTRRRSYRNITGRGFDSRRLHAGRHGARRRDGRVDGEHTVVRLATSARKGPRNGPGPRGAENLNRFRERLDGAGLGGGGRPPCRHRRRGGVPCGQPLWPSGGGTLDRSFLVVKAVPGPRGSAFFRFLISALVSERSEDGWRGGADGDLGVSSLTHRPSSLLEDRHDHHQAACFSRHH